MFDAQPARLIFPKLVFPLEEEIFDKYYRENRNDCLFDLDNSLGHGANSLIIWINEQGVYVPEFDAPKSISKGINKVFTPYHSLEHSRFTVSLKDNQSDVYWILKELEISSFSANGQTYTPIACFDYVLPDEKLPDAKGFSYTERRSAQFQVRSDGAYLASRAFQLETEEEDPEEMEVFFHKINFTFEIDRQTPGN